MIDHNTLIEVGDEVVVRISPDRLVVVRVTKVAGLGLWAADNGMYFQRKDTVEMFKKRDARAENRAKWIRRMAIASYFLGGFAAGVGLFTIATKVLN